MQPTSNYSPYGGLRKEAFFCEEMEPVPDSCLLLLLIKYC